MSVRGPSRPFTALRTLSPVAKLFIQHAYEIAKPLAQRK
jgi:hypothetical protein